MAWAPGKSTGMLSSTQAIKSSLMSCNRYHLLSGGSRLSDRVTPALRPLAVGAVDVVGDGAPAHLGLDDGAAAAGAGLGFAPVLAGYVGRHTGVEDGVEYRPHRHAPVTRRHDVGGVCQLLE